jgi:uridine kinase
MTLVVIGICGGSASGKSTFSRSLADSLSDLEPEVINQDRYFRDWMDYPVDDRARVRTSNHPSAVVWDALVTNVENLRAGRTVEEPVSGTSAFAGQIAVRKIRPGPLLIVEGHLVFTHLALRKLMDWKLYLDVDPHERVLRRMLRDTSRGNMTLEQATAWYRRDVIPNFEVHTAASRKYADLVLPYDSRNDTGCYLVSSGIRAIVSDRSVDTGERGDIRHSTQPRKRTPNG